MTSFVVQGHIFESKQVILIVIIFHNITVLLCFKTK